MLAVEKLLGVEEKIPERCQYIRNLLRNGPGFGASAGNGAFAMDTGAFTVFLHVTEREKIYYLMKL